MFVTKLAKLMFYGDFLHYQEHSTSITGLAYAHAPQGPIPDKYERIRADVVENDVVRVEERNGMDWGGEVLLARRPVDWSVFSEAERSTLKMVRARLGGQTSRRLSDLSHNETGWKQTSVGDRIPYVTAMELEGDQDGKLVGSGRRRRL